MNYTNATSLEEARAATGEFRAAGTDLQERLHSGIAKRGIVDISDIPDLDRIDVLNDGCTIGAFATVHDVGAHALLQQRYPALALTAQTIATPQIRNRATMGGALCQRTRCWYYRHPDLACPKKGDQCACPARTGNNQFGVCFDFGPCVYPHPSSLGLALLAYGAEIEVAGRGRISTAELFGDGRDVTRDHTLAANEIITQIHLPAAAPGERAFYFRQMSRMAAEWPLVEVVVRLMLEGDVVRDAVVGIGAVANIPFRLRSVEQALVGQQPDAATLLRAAALSKNGAEALPQTAYKVPMVVASVLTALEGALGVTR